MTKPLQYTGSIALIMIMAMGEKCWTAIMLYNIITVNNMCFAWGWGWVEAGAGTLQPQQQQSSDNWRGGGHSSLDLIPRNLISKLTFLTMGFNP